MPWKSCFSRVIFSERPYVLSASLPFRPTISYWACLSVAEVGPSSSPHEDPGLARDDPGLPGLHDAGAVVRDLLRALGLGDPDVDLADVLDAGG